jgi:hypothetical protein
MKSSKKRVLRNTSTSAQQGNPFQGVALPKPQLPRWVGSALNLTANNSVSPQKTFLDIPIVPQQYDIDGTGTIAPAQSVTPLGPSIIPNFTQLGGVFKEYCITGFRGELRCVDNRTAVAMTLQRGLVLGAIDEKSSATPTFATMQDLPHLEAVVSLTESPARHLIEWKPQDLEDLQWQFTSTLTPVVPAWFKVFCNPANTFTDSSVGAGSAIFALTGCMRVALRGLE